jgi:hypothetical protein
MASPHDPNQPPYGQPQPPPAPPPAAPPPAAPPPAQPPAAPPPAQPPQPVQPAAMAAVEGWAVKRSVVRVVLLLFGGTYIFYWFYKTRPKVTAELGTHDNVTGQTWGLLVPILNWFIIYWLLRDIAEVRRRMGMPNDLDAVVMLVIWIFVSPAGIGLSQNQLNEYWDRRSNGYATDAPLTFAEVLAAVALWIFFILLAVIIVIIAVAVS